MKEGRSQSNDRQNLQWEYHFFHVVAVVHDEGRGTVGAFRKQPVNDHSDEKQYRESTFASVYSDPARLEDLRKHECVNGQHQDRVEKRPGQAHYRSSISADDLALGHLRDQRPVFPEADRQAGGAGSMTQVSIHYSNTSASCRRAAMSSLADKVGASV
ncbi:hypothetical protein D3C71_1722980 [compost metagenome]